MTKNGSILGHVSLMCRMQNKGAQGLDIGNYVISKRVTFLGRFDVMCLYGYNVIPPRVSYWCSELVASNRYGR